MSSTNLIAQACFGLGNFKTLDIPTPVLKNNTVESIPLDLFNITI